MEGENTQKPAELDKTRVLVLAKNPDGIRGALAFLNRRDVEAFAVSNMNDAVEQLAKKPVKFLLLSVNFPHPKVEMLPALFSQTFGAEVIGFAEASDRKTESRLSNIKTRHIIFGFLTGPVILLKIRQIEKEEEAAIANSGANAATSNRGDMPAPGDNNSDVVISGRGNSAQQDKQIVLKGQRTPDPDAAAKFLKALGEVSAAEHGSVDGTPPSPRELVEKTQNADAVDEDSRKKEKLASLLRSKQKSAEATAEPGTIEENAKDQLKRDAKKSQEKQDRNRQDLEKQNHEKQNKKVDREDERVVQPSQAVAILDEEPNERSREAKEAAKGKQEQPAAARTPVEQSSDLASREPKEKPQERKNPGRQSVEKPAEDFDDSVTDTRFASALKAMLDAGLVNTKKGTFVAKGFRPTKFMEFQEKPRSRRGIGAYSTDPRLRELPFIPEQQGKKRPMAERQDGASGDSKSAMQSGPTDGDIPILDDVDTGPVSSAEGKTHSKGTSGSHSRPEPPSGVTTHPMKTVIWESANDALMEISQADAINAFPISDVHFVGLLMVRHRQARGCLMIGVGNARQGAKRAIDAIRLRFIANLQAHGIAIQERDCTLLELDDAEFPQTLFAGGEFSLSVAQPGFSAGITFLEIDSIEPVLDPAFDNMFFIDVSAIVPGYPVNFEAYIHMPTNQKMIRYLKDGSRLSADKREKLIAGGVARLLVPTKDQRAFRVFFARNCIHHEVERLNQVREEKGRALAA